MSDPWQSLADELNLWSAQGLTTTLWWRDDDAVTVTEALERLLHLAERHGNPLAIAAIPAEADAALSERLARPGRFQVLQHGYAHRNHAPPGKKKCELGADRPLEAVVPELSEGRRRLEDAFGRRFLPVLVPPWNRVDRAVVEALPGIGLHGLSTFGPRHTRLAADGLVEANVHIDIIDWRGSRGFVGIERALDQMAGNLRDRRTGHADAGEPTGLMTHHLAHDEGCWTFLAELLDFLAGHDAVAWPDPAAIFGIDEQGKG